MDSSVQFSLTYELFSILVSSGSDTSEDGTNAADSDKDAKNESENESVDSSGGEEEDFNPFGGSGSEEDGKCRYFSPCASE